jgi:ATP-dependent RNA helicase RhlE
MKFKDYPISQEIKDQLDRLGFIRPTDIQYRAIQPILDGEDVMAVAQTGTGKTAAFVIPILEKIRRSKQNKRNSEIQCLVMVPTRELAKQIASVFHEIGKNSKVKTLGLIGGVEQDSQIKSLQNSVDVLVTTPGRMFDLISQGYIQLDKIQTLVLDEADLMLDLGFHKDIEDVLKFLPKKRQTLFFTATIDKKIKKLAYQVVKDALRIQFSPKNPVAGKVDHTVAFIEMDDKRFFLENILKEYENGKFIVFVRTKVRAERVEAAMDRVGVKVESLHGGMDQKKRFELLDRFRSGENNVLVTTDVAARGIDIPDVDYVVNYDLPENPENYVHRCGRTGRGNRQGQAISFCSTEEKKLLKEIEEYTGGNIEVYDLNPNDYQWIIGGTEDLTYNWKKLIDDANKELDSENEW